MTKSTKLVLDNAILEEEFFEDVHLMGLVAAETPSRLVWQITQHSHYHFKRDVEQDIEVSGQYFPLFTWYEEADMLEHYLISNQCQGHFMLPEVKPVDYLWMVKGYRFREKEKELLMQFQRSLPAVRMVMDLPTSKIKNRHYLIL